MAVERNEQTEEAPTFNRRLVSWPLALIGLTLALVFVANSVSAWGRRNMDDIEDIKSHAEHFVDRALDRLDATDEQEVAIQTIVAGSIEQLHAARGDWAVDREALRGLVLADTVDRDAVEAFRVAKLERADAMSRIFASGIADIMEVLTPEQRADLEEHFDHHRGHGGHHRWGSH